MNGLDKKDWCRFLDCYLGEGKPPADGMSLWQDMNDQQRLVVNEVKKCLLRLKRRSGKADEQTEALARAMSSG